MGEQQDAATSGQVQPTKGRIVLFREFETNGEVEHPAMVTKHHGGGNVNLVVFPDFGVPFTQGSVPHVPEGRTGYGWRWPPRE